MKIEIKGEAKNKLVELGIGTEVGDKVLLNEVEYLYAKNKGILKEEIGVKGEVKDLLKVYSFLMDRGYICRFSLKMKDYIRVGKKGYRRGEDRTKYLVKVVKNISKKEIEEDLKFSLRLRKKLIYCFVGEKIEFIKIDRKEFP